MPSYAHLEIDLRCPRCDAPIVDLLWFQWGFCPGRGPRDEYLYHIGDRIRWKTCQDGTIHPWTVFMRGKHERGANVGTPEVHDLLVRDEAQFFWQPPADGKSAQDVMSPLGGQTTTASGQVFDDTKPPQCRTCQQAIGGASLEIRDDIITRAWIYLPGKFDQRTVYYLIDHNGSLTPMPAWSDHSMEFREEC